MKPTRCCVQTQKGTRCANEPSPVRPSRMIGPVRLAACGLESHQRALWSLPGFIRHDAYCGAFGCDRPSNAGICPTHRNMYRDFGITEHQLFAQEAPMTEPTPLSKLPDLGFARIQVQTSGASLADLEAAVAKVTPPAEPQEAADGGATLPAVDAVEPSEGDVADAPLFVGGTDSVPALAARSPTAPTLAEVQAELARERERAIAAERTAHGAQGEVRRGREAVARLEKLLAGAEERADRAELDAVQERERADAAQAQLREAVAELAAIAALLDLEDATAYHAEDQPIPLPTRVQVALMPDTAYERELRKSLHAVEAELFEVDRTLQHLGAYGNGPTVDRLLKVLTPEDRRNILELQAAEARLDLARLKASRLNPPPPEKLAEAAAKVAEVEARIAALDR